MNSNAIWKPLLATPAFLGTVLVTSAIATPAGSAHADEPAPAVNSFEVANEDPAALDQVTSVSQLTDVRPTDWAFQALQSLVERYGCIVGYPDRTYRGNRALSRYEFAAGVNACMDRISELLAAATADLVRKEDLLALQKLQEEFAAELAALRGRVDQLEVRTATLEKQQFSTTTKLRGEVIFAVADTFGDRVGGNSDDTQVIFGNRVRLSLATSFTGKDLLLTRLNTGNIPSFTGTTGTNMARLSFDEPLNNSLQVDKLYYRFPVGDKLRIQIDASKQEFYEGLVNPLSPIASSGLGSVSRFGRFNPIFRSGGSATGGSAGATFDYKFSESFSLQGGYVGDVASGNPLSSNGLFNGGNTFMGQLLFTPSNFSVGLTYAHSYYPGNDVNVTGSTGSLLAIRPFGAVATTVDTFAGQLQYRFSPNFILGGWFGYQKAHQRANSNDATIINWAGYLAFPDLGKKGNLGAILVGMPPKVTDNDIGAREDDDTTIHLEAFYRYRINDNIYITPGVFVLFNPEHNNDNNTQFVGTIRTTFTF
ncbi:MAG: iron uptake porin [Leptolyngbyaceae cyanobacterium HOT.MB2.61]|nr:iron uptake porin [Leptolyngbyaceae cyanobacterium HOT.MB2.61]